MLEGLTTAEKCEVILQHIITFCETYDTHIRIGIKSHGDTKQMTWQEKVDCLYKILNEKGVEFF